MNTQRVISAMICFLSILFLFQFRVKIWAQNENVPVQIALSSHPLASAYNNGRRMVRDDNDVRYLVYQDFVNSIPIICFVNSIDGKNWSQPDTIFAGTFPSIAIDKLNRLYLVWQAADTSNIFLTYSNDWGTSWKTPPINIIQCDSEKTQFPVIEAGRCRLHIAWQQDFYLKPWRKIQEIFYTSISLDSLESSFFKPINISLSEQQSKFPSIAHNLDRGEGNLHVVWYDSTSMDSSIVTMIMYRAVSESIITWEPPLSLPAYVLSDNRCSDAIHPAVSVGSGEFVHVVWGNLRRDRFYSFMFTAGYLTFFTPYKIEIPADPFICVDDAIAKSTALVWMENNEIFYLQTRNAQPIFLNPIPVSQADEVNSMFPSVCYKHVKEDSLDVVWTEGNAPPYKIMYRRLKKHYSPQQVKQKEKSDQMPQKVVLNQNYPNPFNESTTIQYEISQPGFVILEIYNLNSQKVRSLVAENKPAGRYQIKWDACDEQGNKVSSGIYLYQLQAGTGQSLHKIVLLK